MGELELGVPCRMQHLLSGCKLLDDNEPLGKIFNTGPARSQGTLYLLTEVMRPVRADYLEDQEEINNEVRAMLIDWLVRVHNKCKFRRETLFLAVALLDCYLAQEPVPLRRLKLMGITALRIAAKHEESHFPSIIDIVRICDNVYTPKELH